MPSKELSSNISTETIIEYNISTQTINTFEFKVDQTIIDTSMYVNDISPLFLEPIDSPEYFP